MASLPPPPPLPPGSHRNSLVAAAETKDAGGTTLEESSHRRDSSDRDGEDSSSSVDLRKEIYDTSAIDPVLAKKMALTNNAIDEIGMTPWQWKLFFLNGFGYAVDSVGALLVPLI